MNTYVFMYVCMYIEYLEEKNCDIRSNRRKNEIYICSKINALAVKMTSKFSLLRKKLANKKLTTIMHIEIAIKLIDSGAIH